MATASVPVLNEVLQASPQKTNFMRLSTLLICGGTRIIRELFDSFIAPKDLANKLNDPTVFNTLLQLKRRRILTAIEWGKLFPPSTSSTVVDSKSFDLTLLVKLLREICGLTPPAMGWDKLPPPTDTSLGADLARIKWYRNKVSHGNDGMILSDDDFEDYWDEIKGALLRILQHYSDNSTVAKCEREIDNCRTAPLTNNDMERLKEMLGCSDLIVLCITKVASTGATWLAGSAVILRQRLNDILDYFAPVRGVEVVDVTQGSIKIVLWITELNALEKLWRSYQTGELRKDLERVMITEELKKLANGDVVEFDISIRKEDYERAREYLKGKEEDTIVQALAKTKLTPDFNIFDGDIFEDDENKFQAHLAVITSKEQAEQVLTDLKRKDPEIAEATHNIWAYRIFDEKTKSYFEHCDDDGDDTSGAKVLHLLQRTKAMDVMVVVSCWYETTADDLGPVRFKYTKKCVLDLLLSCELIELEASKLKKYFEEIKYTPFEKMEREAPKFDIIHGNTIEDRRSTFQAHLAEITSREQVELVLTELKKDRKIAKATYNMWACRVYDEKKKGYIVDNDDDGENLAGGRLSHLLEISDAKNVIIVVTRWHGGIHIGSDRFKHINKCASDLLQHRSRPADTSATSADTKEKKKKTKKHK